MGLIDFVKSAGQQIGLIEKDEPKQQTGAAAGGPSAEQLENLRTRRLAAGIVEVVGKMGFDVEDLSVRVDGDIARVSGQVPSQEIREKVVLLVGNTAGIAQVDDQLTVESPEPESTMYTVVSGDTLSGIAKKQYGNAGKYMVIFEANKPMLKDPNKIYPGQVLRIPPLS